MHCQCRAQELATSQGDEANAPYKLTRSKMSVALATDQDVYMYPMIDGIKNGFWHKKASIL